MKINTDLIIDFQVWKIKNFFHLFLIFTLGIVGCISVKKNASINIQEKKELNLFVFDSVSGNGVSGAKIFVSNSAKVKDTLITNSRGYVIINLDKKYKYIITISCEKYYTRQILIPDVNKVPSTHKQGLERLIIKSSYLPVILFNFEETKNKVEAVVKRLQPTIKILNDNSTLKLRIIGYRDSQEKKDSMINIERCKFVKDLLVKGGIAPSRLLVVNGGTLSRTIHEDEVYFKVDDQLTDEFISKLDNDVKELARAENRRVELWPLGE